VTPIEALRARRRIAPLVVRTPMVRSAWLSDLAGTTVWLKLELVQVSNSFKARGAFNAVIARLERGGAPARLVTASAGNHGRALAAAAEVFGVPLVVFTPSDAPRTKLSAIRRHGAELHADARDYDAAERNAKAFAHETGAEFISPYNDPDVIAGAATIAIEIAEDLPAADALVVPVGGGGLASGVAAFAKITNPAVDVIGVEAAVSCAFQTGLRAGRLVEIVPGRTIADALGGNADPETITFSLVQRFVTEIVTVTEDDLAAAIVGLIGEEHLVAEGGGAAGVAALLGNRIARRGYRHMVIVVSGGNIDRELLASLLTASSPRGAGS
jgi:threonine dehydratase